MKTLFSKLVRLRVLALLAVFVLVTAGSCGKGKNNSPLTAPQVSSSVKGSTSAGEARAMTNNLLLSTISAY